MKIYSLITGILITVLLLGVLVIAGTTDTKTTTATVTVSEWLSVTLSNVPIQFPNMDPGATNNASVGNGYPATATIGSESNINANVSTKANQTNFVSGSNTFNVGNMTWDDATTGPWTGYTTTDAKVCSNVVAGGTCNIYHQLAVPTGQAAGTYNVGVTITATKA